MTYYTIAPEEALQHIVRAFWVLESDAPYTHHSMADVCPELLFHYEGQFMDITADAPTPSYAAGFHGQTGLTRQFSIDRAFGMFGVYLLPQSIPLLFNLPARELTNQMPDLRTLLGPEGSALEEQMMLAADNQQRTRIISSFLRSRLARSEKPAPPVFSCIRLLLNSKGHTSIRQLAGEHFLSERQFERQFGEYAGLSPKFFLRIVRFHAALSHYGKARSLTSIAHDCGYYDQSHFIRDFKEFSGYEPRQFFSGKTAASEWRD